MVIDLTGGRAATRFLVVLLAAAAAACVAPSVAGAVSRPVTRLIPPGDSADSQYVEDVPTDQGAAPTPTAATAGGGGQALSGRQGRLLGRLGPDGRLLAAVVDATAPASAASTSGTGPGAGAHARPSGGGGADRKGGEASRAASVAADGGAADTTSAGVLSRATVRSPASLLISAVAGGGLGLLVPGLLVVSAIALVLRTALGRRERR